MNQGRIWCVVSPNVGLPLLLGSVAVTSLIVHACVMTHTTWMSTYWQGAKAKVAMEGTTAPVASATPGSAFAMTVTPAPATGGAQQASFVITVTPNATTPPTVAVANVEPAAGDHAAVAPPDHPPAVN